VMLHFIDCIDPKSTWRKELIALIDHYSIDTTHMDFPDKWRTRPIWQEHSQ
jgi:hypothetical protein